MKRIAYDSYGGPEVMYVEEFTPAAPGPDQVVVTVKAASINPIDWKIRLGYMRQMSGEDFPRAMGSEFAGIVSQVGGDVVDFRPGDEVVGATTFAEQNAFSETATTVQGLVAKKPPELSFVEATATALVGVTAWLSLVKTAKLQPGQHVLINGALGGVGQAAVTLAKSIGAHVTGRVAPGAAADAEAIGVDRVLDYAQPVPAELAGSFDAVFDVNGSLTPDVTRTLIRPGGVVVDINPTDEKMAALQEADTFKLVIAEGNRENLEAVLALAANGELRVPVSQVRPFGEAIALIKELEAGQRVPGKSVISFD